MNFLLIFLTGVALLGVLFFNLLDKKKIYSQWGIGMMLGLILISFSLVYGGQINSIVRGTKAQIRTWNVYHYYLNSKYFTELGYFDLYNCTILVDKENGSDIFNNALIRDLYTYDLVNSDALDSCPKDTFSVQRWESFGNDVSDVLSLENNEYWREPLKDKGFNPSPSWVSITKPFARLISFESIGITNMVLSMDVVLLVMAIIVIGFTFGVGQAVIIGLFTILYFGTFGRLMGNFFQYLWLTSILFALSAINNRKIALGAVLTAFSVSLRIFPLVLLIGPGIKLVQLYIAKREGISTNNELRRQLVHFFYWFLGASILFGLLGLFSGRGVNCWIEFLQKMSIHSSFIAGEGFNMGLRNFISALPIGGELAYVGYVLILSVVTWSFIKIIRELDNLVSLFSVSSILIYFLMTLSPYYYLLLAVLLLLPDTKASKFVSISLFGLLFVQALVNPRAFISLLAIGESVTEVSVLVFSVIFLIVLLRANPEGSKKSH